MIGSRPIGYAPLTGVLSEGPPPPAVEAVDITSRIGARVENVAVRVTSHGFTTDAQAGSALSAARFMTAGLQWVVVESDEFSQQRLVSAAAAHQIGVRSTCSASAMLQAAVSALISGGQLFPAEAASPDVWVLNIESGGFTRYEDFAFNSYAKIGANYYGCRPDGIYQLDGDTDNGAPIRAMVSFGKQDFGTSALKRITNAYIGVSGQGRLFLKVMAEGQEYTYAARSYDEHIQVQRIDTGKGLRVNWLEFELYNADGEDFELASVEFAVVPLGRRI